MHLRAALALALPAALALPGLRAGDAPGDQAAADAAARYAKADWVMVWHDEFEHGPEPSPARWRYEVGRVRNHEAQYYTANRLENARVEDGQLIITGRRETWMGADYTSGSLTTRGTFAFTYGKVEISAKVPTGRGTWPALWFLGASDKDGWPHCGEVDLMENVGFDPDKIHFTVHTGAFNHVMHTERGTAVALARPWADFHRYGLLWSHERIEFFLDGQKVSEFANDGQGREHWPFDSPMYLIVNLALGGAWGGQKGINDAIFPVEFRIDYVRIWQAKAG